MDSLISTVSYQPILGRKFLLGIKNFLAHLMVGIYNFLARLMVDRAGLPEHIPLSSKLFWLNSLLLSGNQLRYTRV